MIKPINVPIIYGMIVCFSFMVTPEITAVYESIFLFYHDILKNSKKMKSLTFKMALNIMTLLGGTIMIDLLIQYGIPIVLGLWIGWLLTRRKRQAIMQTERHLIHYETFKQNMRKGQLVDIRKKEAFEADRIKGARNFSVSYLKSKRQTQIRKDKPLFLYCQNGRKSYRAAKKLTKRGFRSIYVLEGGFNAIDK